MKTYLLVPILMSAMLLSACGGGGSSDGGSDGDTGGSAHCSERTEYTGSIEGAGVTFQRNDCNNLIYYRDGYTPGDSTSGRYPIKIARQAGFLCETYSRQRFRRGDYENITDKENTHCFEDNGVFVQRTVEQSGSSTHISVDERYYEDRDMENVTGSSSYPVYGDGDALFNQYANEWGWSEIARKAREALQAFD